MLHACFTGSTMPPVLQEGPMPPRSTAPALRMLRRFRFTVLVRSHDPTRTLALFGLVNGTMSIGLLALVALATGSPFIFPSLGATAFLQFHQPTAVTASPRNTLVGHLIGASVGWLCLAAFGLLDTPSAMAEGVTWARVGATALSLGGTSALMVLFNVIHPPAGATTLIVSLGLMPHLWQIPVLLGAVLMLTGQAFLINRLAGIRYPLWKIREQGASPPTLRSSRPVTRT